MKWFFILLAAVWAILPIYNYFRIRNLSKENTYILGKLKELMLEMQGVPMQKAQAKKVTQETAVKQQEVAIDNVVKNDDAIAKKEAKSDKKEKNNNLEQQFGAKLPVWIGGVALVLAGFFLVKYSIDMGWLSPAVRVVLGILFGFALLFVGNVIRLRPTMPNSQRISQALTGAAIADLYICVYAGTQLYDLIPDLLGFIGMAAITIGAVGLSLLYGAPIALMGLVGGFLTPALISSSNPQPMLLFTYLFIVFFALMHVIRRENWWYLSLPCVWLALLWAVAWFEGGHYTPDHTIWLGLFLMGVSATVALNLRDVDDENAPQEVGGLGVTKIISYMGFGGAIALMGVVAGKAGFGLLEWSLFSVLSLGGIVLAYFNQRLYGFVPWISMAVTAIMILAWQHGDPNIIMLTVALFGAIYALVGYFLIPRSENPLLWAGLSGAAAVSYYLLAYYQITKLPLVIEFEMFWGLLALVISSMAVYAVKEIMDNVPDDYSFKGHLLSIYTVVATAMISIGLGIEVEKEFLSVALAIQVGVLAWINGRIEINIMRKLIGVLAIVFALLLAPQILLIIQLTLHSLAEIKLSLQKSVPLVDWPLFQLGVPAAMFVYASQQLLKEKDDKLVSKMEIGSIALIGVMGYYLTRNIFHMDENVLYVKAGFIERGAITNVFFLFGLACFYVGDRYKRNAVSLSGIVLTCVAMFRLVYFDMFLYNPINAYQNVGSMPIINGLLLTYGITVFWVYRSSKYFVSLERPTLVKISYALCLILMFAYVTLNVRQFFHGEYLNIGVETNAEIYSYSVAWLLMGIGLVFAGIVKNNIMMRYASLGVTLLTVGKVFLFDAGELEGLYRVFSFFGLGLCLIGLSYFYTKYVFNNR